jgi:hypothetical protein
MLFIGLSDLFVCLCMCDISEKNLTVLSESISDSEE